MRILVIEDHAVVRSGLKLVLSAWKPQALILEAENRAQACELVTQTRDLDLVLIDLNLPGASGFDLTDYLITTLPKTPVVVFSGETGSSIIYSALNRGVRGYIVKSSDEQEIRKALDLVLQGKTYAPPAQFTGSPDYLSYNNPTGSHLYDATDTETLSSKQIEILTLLVQGKSNKEISTNLNLSPATVRSYLTIIFRHLNARNRTEAANIARKLGMIS